jgi:hypothetical protein
MTVRCAWCGCYIRETPDHEGLISHGLCPLCAVDLFPKLKADPNPDRPQKEERPR